MAKRDHTREAVASQRSKRERFLKVQLLREAEPKVPWIRLHGLWLLQAGFTPNSRVRVRVMDDCLVITREQTAQELNEIRACSISEKVQKMLLGQID